ncbi:MAG: hypothetical protein RI922_1884 [Bacteroidota bacterium]|jgi:anti-sigma B factor antagonist
MSLDFKISTADAVTVVSFKGKIISDADIQNLLAELEDSKLAVNRVFDFSELTHINSSGINFIIKSLTKTRINSGDLVLCSVGGTVKTLFEMAKIDDIFTIYDSVSDAINHFKN